MKLSTNPGASRSTLLALLAIGVLQALGEGAAATAADPDSVNPCTLITQAEAQAAVGKPVKPGEFMDGLYRFCAFKPANGGTYYVNVSLLSIDKATFDKADPRQFKRVTGSNLDAFFATASPLVSVWHAGNQLQIQVHFEDNAGQAGAEAAELKLATVAVTRF